MSTNKTIPGVARVFENGQQVGRVVTDPSQFQDYYEQHYDMAQVRREWGERYRAQNAMPFRALTEKDSSKSVTLGNHK